MRHSFNLISSPGIQLPAITFKRSGSPEVTVHQQLLSVVLYNFVMQERTKRPRRFSLENITKHLHNLSSAWPANFISETLHEKHTFLLLHGNSKSTSNPLRSKSSQLQLKNMKSGREPGFTAPAFAHSCYSLECWSTPLKQLF